MIDWDKICKPSMTLDVAMVVVLAIYDDTGRVYFRGEHGGRNDRTKWILRTRRLVAYCPSRTWEFG